jgi:mycothiol synthase
VRRARPFGVLGFATGSTYRVTFSGVDVVELDRLGESERAALATLVARVTAAADHPPLPDPELLAVTQGTPSGGRVVLAGHDGGLTGAVIVFPERDGSVSLHLVVDRAGRAEHAGALIEKAVGLVPSGVPVHLWAMAAGPEDDALAARHGFSPERDLLQMRLPLPLDPAVVAASRPLATRPFEPGRDEEVWVDTNNRAFAGHPEQSGWTVSMLRERMAADWVDLEGFLVADDPSGEGFIGSCWTKVHRDHVPVLGEIYVISVDPRHHGQGWGRSLTVAGLTSVAQRGAPVGMLYVDATNQSAVGLYRGLGFEVDHVDRSYRRNPARTARIS